MEPPSPIGMDTSSVKSPEALHLPLLDDSDKRNVVPTATITLPGGVTSPTHHHHPITGIQMTSQPVTNIPKPNQMVTLSSNPVVTNISLPGQPMVTTIPTSNIQTIIGHPTPGQTFLSQVGANQPIIGQPINLGGQPINLSNLSQFFPNQQFQLATNQGGIQPATMTLLTTNPVHNAVQQQPGVVRTAQSILPGISNVTISPATSMQPATVTVVAANPVTNQLVQQTIPQQQHQQQQLHQQQLNQQHVQQLQQQQQQLQQQQQQQQQQQPQLAGTARALPGQPLTVAPVTVTQATATMPTATLVLPPSQIPQIQISDLLLQSNSEGQRIVVEEKSLTEDMDKKKDGKFCMSLCFFLFFINYWC